MKPFFPLNSKTHTMNTRNTNQYEIFKAKKTQRLKNSPIIYMQRLLYAEPKKIRN